MIILPYSEVRLSATKLSPSLSFSSLSCVHEGPRELCAAAWFSTLVAIPSARGGVAVGSNSGLTRSHTVGLAPDLAWRRASEVHEAKAEVDGDGDAEMLMPRAMSPGSRPLNWRSRDTVSMNTRRHRAAAHAADPDDIELLPTPLPKRMLTASRCLSPTRP